MPRNYKCKACHTVHEPPTGKHCRQRDDFTEVKGTSTENAMMPMLMDISRKMEQMQEEMRTIRSEKAAERAEQGDTTAVSPTLALQEESGGSDSEPASPETLRRDRRLMREAAERLNRLRFEEDDDEQIGSDNTRTTGKKSGSVMTATDKVHWGSGRI